MLLFIFFILILGGWVGWFLKSIENSILFHFLFLQASLLNENVPKLSGFIFYLKKTANMQFGILKFLKVRFFRLVDINDSGQITKTVCKLDYLLVEFFQISIHFQIFNHNLYIIKYYFYLMQKEIKMAANLLKKRYGIKNVSCKIRVFHICFSQ